MTGEARAGIGIGSGSAGQMDAEQLLAAAIGLTADIDHRDERALNAHLRLRHRSAHLACQRPPLIEPDLATARACKAIGRIGDDGDAARKLVTDRRIAGAYTARPIDESVAAGQRLEPPQAARALRGVHGARSAPHRCRSSRAAGGRCASRAASLALKRSTCSLRGPPTPAKAARTWRAISVTSSATSTSANPLAQRCSPPMRL